MEGYKKYNNERLLIRSIILNPVKIAVGAVKFRLLISQNKETHYIILPTAIGDSVYALAYLKEYRAQHHINHITVVCTKNVSRICTLWGGDEIDHMISVNRKTIVGLYAFANSTTGKYLRAFPYRDSVTFPYYWAHMIQRGIWWNTVYTLNDFFRNVIYQIEDCSKAQFPKVPDVNLKPFIEKYGLQKGKTVLLNPYANSVKCDVNTLFEGIAEAMLSKGFSVKTLTSSEKDIPVRGTEALPCDLIEAFRIAEYCGTVIALRSGFLDLLVFAKTRMIAIMDIDYGPKDFYKLEAWNVNPDCATVIYDGKSDDETIKEIENTLKGFTPFGE